MDYEKLKKSIERAIILRPDDFEAYDDMFNVCMAAGSHDWNHELRDKVTTALTYAAETSNFKAAEKFDDLMYRSLLFSAPFYFDDYLQAVEYGKTYDKKFYQPRRHYLLRYVNAYQEILDGTGMKSTSWTWCLMTLPRKPRNPSVRGPCRRTRLWRRPSRVTTLVATLPETCKTF